MHRSRQWYYVICVTTIFTSDPDAIKKLYTTPGPCRVEDGLSKHEQLWKKNLSSTRVISLVFCINSGLGTTFRAIVRPRQGSLTGRALGVFAGWTVLAGRNWRTRNTITWYHAVCGMQWHRRGPHENISYKNRPESLRERGLPSAPSMSSDELKEIIQVAQDLWVFSFRCLAHELSLLKFGSQYRNIGGRQFLSSVTRSEELRSVLCVGDRRHLIL